MTARLRYPEVAPEGYAALSAFGHYVNTGTALEPVLLGLVYLRASVLNGCTFCTELHKAELRKHHEPESRIEAVGSAPAAEAFTPREQAALRWTEVITRLEDQHASDDDFAAVSRFFTGKDLVDLTYAIANINAWNRMGVAFQPAWRPRAGGAAAGASDPAANVETAERPSQTPGRGAEPRAGGVSVGSGARASGTGAAPAAGGAAGEEDDGGKVGTD